MASNAIAVAGNSPSYFMSPYHTKMLVEDMASGPLGEHISDYTNPHQVTKAQVGLGGVDNFITASEVEARDATAIDRFMTPYLVRLSINELVGDVAGSHINSDANPHNVTKAQVGLGLVSNYATATAVEANDGLRGDRFMTPQTVRSAIDSYVSSSYGNLGNRLNELETTQTNNGTTLTEHVSDLNNPHQVTIDQVGGYAASDIDTLLLGKLSINDTAANSALFAGLTLPDLLDSITLDIEQIYVTNEEIVILNQNLTTAFEDSMWDLSGKHVIRFESGDLSGSLLNLRTWFKALTGIAAAAG